MSEVLSSTATFFYRYVWPAAWLSSLLVLALLLVAGQWNGPPLVAMILGYTVVATRYFFVLRHLHRVVATEDGLLVSDYRREVLVPWSNVARIRGNRWSRHGMIIVELLSPTAVGGRVAFLPYQKVDADLARALSGPRHRGARRPRDITEGAAMRASWAKSYLEAAVGIPQRLPIRAAKPPGQHTALPGRSRLSLRPSSRGCEPCSSATAGHGLRL